VAIDAVDAGVELAADEPFRVRRLPFEDARPRRDPFELAREAGPERFGVGIRPRVDRGVVDHGVAPELVGRREAAILLQ